MDAIDKELDKLLLMIERMPKGEMKDKLLERYDGYRKKFEDNPRDITVISSTGMEILWFETDVKMFTEGMPNVDPLRDYHVLQPLQVNGKNGKSSEIQEIENILTEILDSKILSNDIDSLKNTIDEIQEEYKGLGSKSQTLEQKIAESRYTLMKGLLKGDRIEEATKLAEQFNEDMSLFLYKKLSPQIDTLRKSGRLQDALFLAKYCKDGEPKETDLEFWEKLINIEEPELDYRLPEEEKQELIAVKKDGLLERLKRKHEQRINDKKTEKESKIKVMHIRFDPASDFHHMNKKDCMRVSKAISEETDGKKKANIRIVFDEGITEVTLPEPPYKDSGSIGSKR